MFALVLFFPLLASAVQINQHRIIEGSFTTKLQWGSKRPESIELSYHYVSPLKSNLLRRAIIFVPGGPGNSAQSSFLAFDPPALSMLSDTNTLLVYHSPRGANSRFWLTSKLLARTGPELFSIEQQSQDLSRLSAVLKARYPSLSEVWLYGHSHGGMVVS